MVSPTDFRPYLKFCNHYIIPFVFFENSKFEFWKCDNELDLYGANESNLSNS